MQAIAVSRLGRLVFCAAIVASTAFAAPAYASFGVNDFEMPVLEEGGAPATQAASHPSSFTTTIFYTQHPPSPFQRERGLGTSGSLGGEGGIPDGDVKDLEVTLPTGLVIYPLATERCSEVELEAERCPAASQIGEITLESGLGAVNNEGAVAVYDMLPSAADVPAELGIVLAGENVAVHIVGGTNPTRGYALSAKIANIEQFATLDGSRLTLWGYPSAASHDTRRACNGALIESVPCDIAVPRTERPFVRLPSACGGSVAGLMTADSWQEPGAFLRPIESLPLSGMTGCESLGFDPTIEVKPEAEAADTPTGLNVRVSFPQSEGAGSTGEADLKDAVVTLPAGLSVNPSVANGLGACTDTPEPAQGGEPERPGGEIELKSSAPVRCPNSSKLGTVEIKTPLLEKPLAGSLFLAQPRPESAAEPGRGSNPFESLVAFYVVAEGSGIVVKLPGVVRLDQNTGQVSAEIGEDPATGYFPPQAPVSEVRVSSFGGSGAAFTTPSTCGSYTASSELTPYSAPLSGQPVTHQSTFAVTSGCGNGFSPSFSAGTTGNQAGAYGPLTVTFSRQDGEQGINAIQVRMPPGLLGAISHVPLCGEPQAQEGTCGPESEIGSVAAAAGAGPEPVWITNGRAYLTGPYRGAPFGLSIVVPAIAGPFNLGNVVVRAAIAVDPKTSAVTVTSDPLPQIRQGVPLQVKTVSVDIDRHQFMFNPTSCAPMSINATIQGTSGATAGVSAPFQAANCGSLAFKPKLSMSTQGKTSKANGASLVVKVTQVPGEANIHSVDLQLPKALPARFATLHGACTEAQFDTDPAGCPPGSVIGSASAVTPVLNVPLTGPAYLVSHGGAAFPDVVFVLQGQGVTIDLTGETEIKKGIIYSRFETVPDAPISFFEASLPEGPHSVLATNLPAKAGRSFCGRSLTAPIRITAQSGAQVKQNNVIQVIGCPKPRKPSKGNAGKRHRRDSVGV